MSSTKSPLAVAPRVRLAPPAARNDAEFIVELAAAYGTEFDPWQLDVLEAGCGRLDDGSWAAETVGCNVARQNGKSVILVARALAGLLVFGEKTIACSAHRQGTSRELFRALKSFFDNFDDLRRRVVTINGALGREVIELRGGARVLFPARTRQSVRGLGFDLYLADESQLATQEQWEDVLPTTSTRSVRQVWMFGTAPQLVTDAEVFGKMRAAAHAGAPGLAWIEYGAQPGCDLDDQDQWRQANPGRVQVSAMETERRDLSPGGFARERLNLWPTDCEERVFSMDRWASLISPGPARGTKVTAIGVDASPLPGREFAVVWCWRLADERYHVELAGVGGMDTLGALDLVLEQAARRTPILIDARSPAADLIGLLRSRKFNVRDTTSAEMGAAAGGFLNDVVAGRLTHANQSALNDAVAGAHKRAIGEAGAFAWDRRDGSVFLAPLVAATLARSAAVAERRMGGACFV